jgi:hypothetical protein
MQISYALPLSTRKPLATAIGYSLIKRYARIISYLYIK